MTTQPDDGLVVGRRYQLQQQIGVGGMGEVFRATDQHTGEIVAVKRLKQIAQDNGGEHIVRFIREAEALRQLNHPNIVRVYEQFKDDGKHYFVMEYVSGGSLDMILHDLRNRDAQMPIFEVVNRALDIADALTRAHHLRIVHRDLKPANLLCAEDGSIRLSDFGIAGFEWVNGKRFTESGDIIGTLDYISPEMLNNSTADHRTDIWAFGVVLFEMLTTKRPFVGDSIGGLMNAILTKPVPHLEAQRPDAPASLIDLVYRLLEKDPQRRIPSMRLVGTSLEAIRSDLHQEALSPTPIYPLSNPYPVTTETTPPNGVVRHNLPLPATPFIGRTTDIHDIKALLYQPTTRLLTISASGGMGKTRLALEIAHQMVNTLTTPFKDGVYFVELASLATADSLVTELADALGLTLEASGMAYRRQVIQYLSQKQALIIFDNFEHLLEATALVSEILQEALAISMLVTSRERLNLQGETIYRLEGLELLKDNPAMTSAVQLFVQSATYAQPAFYLKPENIAEVVAICEMVEGLPLGIVLAAGWVSLLTTQEIVTEMQRTLNFLESSARDLPARHRSLRAVFDYSWELMNAEERDVLMRLAVFQGGFTREAAQKVTKARLQVLLALVNKSLLTRDPASGRYTCHPLMRQYAAEALERADATQSARDAHCHYFLDLMYQHRIDLSGQRSQTFDEFEADMENIRMAWSYALDTKQYAAIQRAMSGLVSR